LFSEEQDILYDTEIWVFLSLHFLVEYFYFADFMLI